ncbi:hypothetical protein [Priestia taiwanensis]|uniref:Uncharacterized protein n=1 Tax=Priestia taiwanensis TaxID=1347902 RepID=A0A917AJM9_9BACI|nr:hypothetical protein [Priestia taiwanensis]MBM7361913.1 uncharacterized protein YlzI (FlbEa/FlbD family) [Priestia taiwanensis]GGE57953.1 hypothetical protein GCM10007140_05410 [Priestia taiwanensis]
MKYICILFEDGKYYIVTSKEGEVVNPKVEITKEAADELIKAGAPLCEE